MSLQRQRPRTSAESTAPGLTDVQLHIVAEATRIGLWSWDLRTQEVTWNQHMHTITGLDTPIDLTQWSEQLSHPDDRGELRERAAAPPQPGPLDSHLSRIVRPDGELRWVTTSGTVLVDAEGQPTTMVGATMDMTDQQKVLNRLKQAQRMETVGNLAAGVAHNFNNMLMVIGPCLESLQEEMPATRHQILQDALDATDRAASIVRQLMLIAGHRAAGAPERHSTAALVGNVTRICRRALPEEMRLTVQIIADCELSAEDGALNQILTNLILNARDALADHGSSAPEINVTVDSELRFGERWANIIVSDNGPGIPDEHQGRIFEPFFTTKAGSGTGLGLTTCQAIVQRHGGQLACRSRSGCTEFLLLLPATQAIPPQPVVQAPAESIPAETKPKVLLVDDEPSIRRMVERGLSRGGCTVSEAANRAEVEQRLADDPSPDIVLLDRTLGAESGCDMLSMLRARAPDAKILFFTGQYIEPNEAALVDGVVQKPVSAKELLRIVRNALVSSS